MNSNSNLNENSIDCGIIRIIGIFLCLGSLIGFVLNGSLLLSFVRYQFLRTAQNIFMMYLSLIGFIASLSILPLTGSSSIYCRWLFSQWGCQFEAMMAFLYGCSTSYLLCSVSLIRAFILLRPFQAKSITVLFFSLLPSPFSLFHFILGFKMCCHRFNLCIHCFSLDNLSHSWME